MMSQIDDLPHLRHLTKKAEHFLRSRLVEKGTQFQLYLALRLAGYEEYAAARPSVPFIADDIMETDISVASLEAPCRDSPTRVSRSFSA